MVWFAHHILLIEQFCSSILVLISFQFDWWNYKFISNYWTDFIFLNHIFYIHIVRYRILDSYHYFFWIILLCPICFNLSFFPWNAMPFDSIVAFELINKLSNKIPWICFFLFTITLSSACQTLFDHIVGFSSILWFSAHQEIKPSIQNIAHHTNAASCIIINKIIKSKIIWKRNKKEKINKNWPMNSWKTQMNGMESFER